MMIADLQVRFNIIKHSILVSPKMKDIIRNFVYAQNMINAHDRDTGHII